MRDLRRANFQSSHPWSAAFISWVMRRAGVGRQFRSSGAHAVYISWAKKNRLRRSSNPFKAYRISEVSPVVGDLVCRSRAGSRATYDNIRPGLKTHCDIVVGKGYRRIYTIGGNVSNSVSITAVPVNERGRITHSSYFAVIRYGLV